MPAPQASVMKQFARLKFSSNALRVPDKYQPPVNQEHYGKAFKEQEKNTAPDTTAPPLFTPATMNKYHTDTQKKLTAQIGGFIDAICTATCAAWDQWQKAAVLTLVTVTGPLAIGGVVAPVPLTPLIFANFQSSALVKTPQILKYATTISNVLGQVWLQYTATMKVPSLPFWPMFAAWPAPAAPPTPNTPFPVAAIAPAGAAMMQPQGLSGQMFSQHGDPQAAYAREIFDAVANAFSQCFMVWQTATQITKVLGAGAVPTCVPPVMPPGPVVGIANMTPGGFA